MTYELEPRRELQSAILKHSPEFPGGDVSGILNLVWVRLYVNIGFDKEDVINCENQTV